MAEVKTQLFIATILIAGSIAYRNWDTSPPVKTWYEYRTSMYGTKVGYLPRCEAILPVPVKIVTRWKTDHLIGKLKVMKVDCEYDHTIYSGKYEDTMGCEGTFRIFKSKNNSRIQMWADKNCGEMNNFDLKLHKSSGKSF